MTRLFPSLHPDDRHDAIGFVIVAVVLFVAHASLRTARDALFLSALPAAELAWVYGGVALIAPVAVRMTGRFRSSAGSFTQLLSAFAFAAAGTAAAAFFAAQGSTWSAYALYVWTGVALAFVLSSLWVLAASRFTRARARRIAPAVAVGMSAGAVAGSACSLAIVAATSPYTLLWFGAVAYAVAGISAWLLLRRRAPAAVDATSDRSAGSVARESLFSATVRPLAEPYVRYFGGSAVVAAFTVTLVDFSFKNAAALAVEPDALGTFFATAYLAINVLLLATASTLTSPAIGRFGAATALAILPASLLVGSLGYLAIGGLGIAVAMKAIDGALRHSLNRTATEILYVPMPPQLRAAVRGGVDVVAQRGGQLLAAVVIAGATILPSPIGATSAVIAAGAALWLWISQALADRYDELYRRALSDDVLEAVIDHPDLGEADLATIVRSLDVADEDRVLAALKILECRGHGRLVPVSILDNESSAVVCKALRLLVASGRVSAIPFATRLMETGESDVRAAAVRAIAELVPDPATLRRAVKADDLGVSAAGLIGLVGCGEVDAYDAAETLIRRLDDSTASERAAIAAAVATVPDRAFTPVLERILREPGEDSRRTALEAMRESENPLLVPAIIEALDDRGIRAEARRALLVLGDIALDKLADALRDPSLSEAVKIQVPRSIAEFRNDRAVGLLLRRVAEGMTDPVGYQSLRAVGRMFEEDATLHAAPEGLDSLIASTLCEIAASIDQRLRLFPAGEPETATGSWLLHRALLDRQARMSECVFRILGIRHRDRTYLRIHQWAVFGDTFARADAHGFLESNVEPELSRALIALTDEISDEAKLEGLDGYYVREANEPEQILTRFARGTDTLLAMLAVYVAAERDGADLRPLCDESGDARRSVVCSEIESEATALLAARGTRPEVR